MMTQEETIEWFCKVLKKNLALGRFIYDYKVQHPTDRFISSTREFMQIIFRRIILYNGFNFSSEYDKKSIKFAFYHYFASDYCIDYSLTNNSQFYINVLSSIRKELF